MDNISQIDFPVPVLENVSKLECPVCFLIPRENVYQCVNGHSFCSQCSSKLSVCPSCQSGGKRIRNLLAESFLEEIKFGCIFKDKGCQQIILRSELSEHEHRCSYNPETINFCSEFREDDTCQYRCTPTWLTEPKNCTDFLNHVKSCLGSTYIENVQYRKKYTSRISTVSLQKDHPYIKPAHKYFKPKFYQIKHTPGEEELKTEIFFRIRLTQLDKNCEKDLSWAFVQLTPVTSPVSMTMSIESVPKSEMILAWGEQSVPNLTWTMKPINFAQFVKMVRTPEQSFETKVSYPFSLSVSNLAKHYVDMNGILSDTISIDLCV